MSMIINAPTARVATYDVANQTDVQFNFDFDPTLMRADGTTLIVEYEGSEIRLENFFDAAGAAQVENFLTQDGQVFSASEFLAATMGGQGGETAEDIETAAAAAAGGSGAGDYSDDPGDLYDGLNALGGQDDAYDREQPERPDEVPGYTLDGNEIYFDSDQRWGLFYDTAGDPWYERLEYAYRAEEDLTANGLNPIKDSQILDGHLRSFDPWVGAPGIVDTLILPDDPYGVALRLEDNLSLAGGGPGLVDIEIIQGGSGSDAIDLSSTTYDYGDVTVYGNDGNDYIWTNIGNDTLHGGDGNDNMIGGLGDDVIYGDAGNDVIKGSIGNDLLNGGDGSDHIFGGEGADTVYGGDGIDIIDGGGGGDVLYGNADSDYILGGDGNDFIHGGADNDLLYGDDGADQINAGTGTHDMVSLGNGNDTLVIDSDSLVSATDTDGPGGAGSMVEVTDFNAGDDHIDLNGYDILDADLNSGDLALFVGDSTGSTHTWIVLDGIAPADLGNVNVIDCGNFDPSTDDLTAMINGMA